MSLKLAIYGLKNLAKSASLFSLLSGLLLMWNSSQAESSRPSYTEEVVASTYERLSRYKTFGDLLKDLEGDDLPTVRLREYIQNRKIEKMLILPRELRGTAIVWRSPDSPVVIQDFSRLTAGVMFINGKEVSIKQNRTPDEIEQDLIRIFSQPQAQLIQATPENPTLLSQAQSLIDRLFSAFLPSAHAARMDIQSVGATISNVIGSAGPAALAQSWENLPLGLYNSALATGISAVILRYQGGAGNSPSMPFYMQNM